MVFPFSLAQNMTSRYNYQWFLPRWLTPNWWLVEEKYQRRPNSGKENTTILEDHPCTDEQMVDAINGYSILARAQFAGDDQQAIGGQSIREWKREYKERLRIQVSEPSVEVVHYRQPSDTGRRRHDTRQRSDSRHRGQIMDTEVRYWTQRSGI